MTWLYTFLALYLVGRKKPTREFVQNAMADGESENQLLIKLGQF
jgi:hypothetical protein